MAGFGVSGFGTGAYGVGGGSPPPITPVPTPLSIAPSEGPVSHGVDVTITGVNFTSDTVITIGGLELVDQIYVNSTTITGTTPTPADEGLADISATNDYGTSILFDGFNYTTTATLSTVVPIDYKSLRVFFYYKPSYESATDPSKYSIDGGVDVTSVEYETDLVYILTTSAMEISDSYELTSTVTLDGY